MKKARCRVDTWPGRLVARDRCHNRRGSTSAACHGLLMMAKLAIPTIIIASSGFAALSAAHGIDAAATERFRGKTRKTPLCSLRRLHAQCASKAWQTSESCRDRGGTWSVDSRCDRAGPAGALL